MLLTGQCSTENCSFFSPPGAQLSVILTREPLGTYKAIILRAEFGGPREVVLSSDSAETVNRAFELLLIKSADAVQNYITTNGFEFAPSSKKVEDVVDGDEDDEDDGVSSILSSVIVDDDPVQNLEDSALSLSEVESAYESVSEDGIDVRYSRARVPHTSSRNTITSTHTYPMRVRRSRSPRRPDDPDFPREGGRQQRSSPPRYLPHHNFPMHKRRPTSPVRVNPKPNNAGVVDGPMGGRHVPPPPIIGRPATPPTPPLPLIGNGGAWRHPPGGAAPPAVMHANTAMINTRADPAGPPRPHPSQYFSLHPPPPQGMTLGSMQPPPAGALQQQQQQQQLHPQGKPPVGVNRDPTSGPPPPTGFMHTFPAGPTIQAGGLGAGAAAPPPPPPSSSLSSASSTPTLTASPNKPPSPPATIDCRLCIRSRGPGAPGPQQQQQDGAGAQARAGQHQQQQQQWHEQRFILRAPPTRAHIRAAALRFVEFNPDKFRHLVGGGGGGDGRLHQHQLRAALTRAVFGGGEGYDLSTYAEDDLSRLCAGMCAAGQGGMPLFEVTVSNVGPAGSSFTLL